MSTTTTFPARIVAKVHHDPDASPEFPWFYTVDAYPPCTGWAVVDENGDVVSEHADRAAAETAAARQDTYRVEAPGYTDPAPMWIDYGSLATREEAWAAVSYVLTHREEHECPEYVHVRADKMRARFAAQQLLSEDDERACAECGDHVGYLSSRDWCDGCELDALRTGDPAAR